MVMRVASVNVGLSRPVWWRGQVISTGIFKQAVAGRIAVRWLNLGDSRPGNKLPRQVLSIAAGVHATIAGSAAGGTRRSVTRCLQAVLALCGSIALCQGGMSLPLLPPKMSHPLIPDGT
jgi:hypothetical protein